ncbi:hypothetical protein BJV78DRAFT_1158050 [Lactifluus subvellereus]|nr:hypothetical protein BJV78DRAFT_1158050 [Lactifluus subvellereus]
MPVPCALLPLPLVTRCLLLMLPSYHHQACTRIERERVCFVKSSVPASAAVRTAAGPCTRDLTPTPLCCFCCCAYCHQARNPTFSLNTSLLGRRCQPLIGQGHEISNSYEPLMLELNLTLESTSVVLTRMLNVIMHLLNVRHEVGQVGAPHRQHLILPNPFLSLQVCTLITQLIHLAICNDEVLRDTIALDIHSGEMLVQVAAAPVTPAIS